MCRMAFRGAAEIGRRRDSRRDDNLCPWNGLRCECRHFPWLNAQDIIPRSCEVHMPDELLGHRKVSDAGKIRYQVYLAELEANRKKARISRHMRRSMPSPSTIRS